MELKYIEKLMNLLGDGVSQIAEDVIGGFDITAQERDLLFRRINEKVIDVATSMDSNVVKEEKINLLMYFNNFLARDVYSDWELVTVLAKPIDRAYILAKGKEEEFRNQPRCQQLDEILVKAKLVGNSRQENSCGVNK